MPQVKQLNWKNLQPKQKKRTPYNFSRYKKSAHKGRAKDKGIWDYTEEKIAAHLFKITS